MLKQEMQNEIDELRAQIATLSAEREAREKEQSQAQSKESDTEPVTQVSSADESGGEEAEITAPEETDIENLFQELVETVDSELKEASPMTVLVVFAFGVLVGRLLPR
jgi:septal ring factor EnvC (AmiA/AmiB activator)